jgi:hypothetical protein
MLIVASLSATFQHADSRKMPRRNIAAAETLG